MNQTVVSFKPSNRFPQKHSSHTHTHIRVSGDPNVCITRGRRKSFSICSSRTRHGPQLWGGPTAWEVCSVVVCFFGCTCLMFGSVLFGGGGETEVDFPVEAPWPRHMVQGRLSVKSVSLRSFQECLTFGKPGEEPIAQWLQPKTHAEIRIDVLQEMAQNLPKPARVLVSQGTCSNCTEARLRRGIGLRRQGIVCA